MEEEKKYLVYIESNLAQYAKDAAEAKKRVDELTASNKALKDSGTASQEEIEANSAALRNAQKEYSAAKKMVDLQTAANRSETGSRKQLSEILRLQELALGKLGNAYITNAKGVQVLNPLYVEQRKRIAETKQAILDYDKTLKDGRSNVGNYGKGITASLKGMTGSLIELAAKLSLVVVAYRKLKEAFLSTEGGAKFLNQTLELSKTLFDNIRGVILNPKSLLNPGEIFKNLKSDLALTNEAVKALDALRIKERGDLKEIATLELSLRDLRLKAADDAITQAEKIVILSEAQKVEAQIIALKTQSIEEQLIELRKLNVAREDETKLLDLINTKEIELINLRGTESLRIEKMVTSLEESRRLRTQELTDEVSLLKKRGFSRDLEELGQAELKELESLEATEEQKVLIREKYQLMRDDLLEKEISSNAKAAYETARLQNEYDLNALENILDLEYEELIRSDEYMSAARSNQLLMDEQYTQAKIELSLRRIDQMDQEKNMVADALGAMSELVGRQTAIGKSMAVAQATINTWVAASQALRDPTLPSTVMKVAAMVAIIATGLANVKNILAVKVPGGGGGSESVPTAITSTVAQRSFAVGSSILTPPQLSQQQLNTLPSQNLLTAQDIANALKNMPPPVVTVEDINARVTAKNKIEVRANI